MFIYGELHNYRFLKETPHYLVTKGKHKEAESMFLHMAGVNGKTLPENFMEELKEGEEAAVKEKLKSILKAPVLLKRTAILIYLYIHIRPKQSSNPTYYMLPYLHLSSVL